KYVSYVMCGVRNGWIPVVDGAQKVVVGVAYAPVAARRTAARTSFFIIGSLLSGGIAATRVHRGRRPRQKSASWDGLDVEVQCKLGRRRPQPHRVQLPLDVVLDPGIDA